MMLIGDDTTHKIENYITYADYPYEVIYYSTIDVHGCGVAGADKVDKEIAKWVSDTVDEKDRLWLSHDIRRSKHTPTKEYFPDSTIGIRFRNEDDRLGFKIRFGL